MSKMKLSDEDKLIINSEMFHTIRTYIRKQKSSAEIIAKIDELLEDGADINACDRNDSNNTILHIAAQKEQKDIVTYILKKGGHLFCNDNEHTAINLALQKNTALGKEIADILSKEGKLAARVVSISNKQHTETVPPQHSDSNTSLVNSQEIIYLKRAGTSGVSGQFYETKLLSLVAHRALHDKEIEEFYLAANIKDIGDFDDVCFRYGNVACFMQTKHRENTDKAKLTVASVRSTTGKLGLGIYYDSFLKIRQKFTPNTTDPMFKGKFNDIESYFILYTPLKESFDKKLLGNKNVCRKLHDIIYTGEKDENKKSKTIDIFQFNYEPQDLEFLTRFIKNEHMKILGKTFLEFILSNNKLEVMMANDLIKIYHPALAQKVIFITKVIDSKKIQTPSKTQHTSNIPNAHKPPQYIQIGRFRPDFFYSEDYNLIALKDTFYKEIVYTHSPKTTLSIEELQEKIQDIAENPCATNISQLIGSPLKFDETNDKLSLDINKIPKNKLKHDEIQQIRYDLQKIQVTRTMVKDAVYLAGHKKLEILSFRLPLTFGNIDLTTNQKSVEGNLKRLDFLANKFHLLINYYADMNKDKQTKVIEINTDVVGPGKILEFSHLNSNGGIGSAVGNLLKFDSQCEFFSFDTKKKLEENSKYVLRKLKQSSNEDLSNYVIKVDMDGFPRVSFDTCQFDKKIAAEFLSRLWFYTNQAQEETVETTLKKEINQQYNTDKQKNQLLFHVHSDAIFLRFHDEIQKWWKRQTEAQYLTKSTIIFEKAKRGIVDSPLLTVLNIMFVRNIENIALEFNVSAITSLNLEDITSKNQNKIINIISDAVTLSAAKIVQYNKHVNIFTFINLDYVHFLPKSDYDTMIQELSVLSNVILVIISENLSEQSHRDTLQIILKAFMQHTDIIKKQVITITRDPLQLDQAEIFQNIHCMSLKDTGVNLSDLTASSQTLFLDTYKITYQGQVVKLNTIIDESSVELLNAKLLWALLNKEKIEIGHALNTHKYNEIKNYYINRQLRKNNSEHVIHTLDDVDDKVVLISAKPCMGKTILLTHLSLETKKVNPKPWIVHINMSAHMKDFQKLAQININKIMAFLSKAAVIKVDNIEKVKFTAIDDEKVALNSKDSNSISFELKLFIHFYNMGNVIFLFDGFDKICPHNTNEGLKLFTALEKANKRIWITSDHYVIKILERKFGSSYKLDALSTLQQKGFLQRFWATNLKLEKLNHDQCYNIAMFLKYIYKTFNQDIVFKDEDENDRNMVPFLSVPLHIIYLTLIQYFKNEANSLSPCYLRDVIKKRCHLDSYTAVDHFLRSNKDESSELAGTPLHLYIAANYFAFQITDKFNLRINTDVIVNKSNVYINAVTLYEQFLKVNIKNICEIENKSAAEKDQDKLRDEFFKRHKNLALYAIFKENDITNILTASEINEVKETLKMIESGEMRTDLIDSVVDGVPRFYHLLFAEYFIVETLADLLKIIKRGDFSDARIKSFWDFLVNAVLVTGPAGLRNAFEYKLKYDPDLAETVSNEKCTKVMFELLLKQRHERNENALDIAINEGLINITNFLINSVQSNLKKENSDRVMTILKSSANILAAVDTSRSILSDDVLKCIQNMDGETIVETLKANQIGGDIHEKIKSKVVEPVKKFTEKLVEVSQNDENLVNLLEELPNHLPDYVRAIFNK